MRGRRSTRCDNSPAARPTSSRMLNSSKGLTALGQCGRNVIYRPPGRGAVHAARGFKMGPVARVNRGESRLERRLGVLRETGAANNARAATDMQKPAETYYINVPA